MVDHNEVGGAIYFKSKWWCLCLKWSNQWLTIELWYRKNEVSSKIISLFCLNLSHSGLEKQDCSWKSRIVVEKAGFGVEKAGLELKKQEWSWKSCTGVEKAGFELKKLVNVEFVENHGRKAWDEATGGRLTSMPATGFKSIRALLWLDPFWQFGIRSPLRQRSEAWSLGSFIFYSSLIRR